MAWKSGNPRDKPSEDGDLTQAMITINGLIHFYVYIRFDIRNDE